MNLYAVLSAAVSSFLPGGLWYSPLLFGRAWKRENGGEVPPGHPGKAFGIGFVFSLLAALAFAWLLGPQPELRKALLCGGVAGLGLVATSFGIIFIGGYLISGAICTLAALTLTRALDQQ